MNIKVGLMLPLIKKSDSKKFQGSSERSITLIIRGRFMGMIYKRRTVRVEVMYLIDMTIFIHLTS